MGYSGTAFQIAQTYCGLVRYPQELAARGTRRSRSGSQMRPGCMCLCVCTCIRMCLCRTQWRDPRSKASYWMDWMSKPSYWNDPFCVCVCVYACTVRQSVPAAGVGLQPQELVHPDASNWEDQGIQRQLLEGLCVCAQLVGGPTFCTCMYFPLTDLHCDCSERGTG